MPTARWRGCLGVWNRPKPMPQIASLQTSARSPGWAGRARISSRPAASVSRPKPPIRPADQRSESRPAIGRDQRQRQRPTASAAGRSAPASGRACPGCRREAKTKASICAAKEAIEVAIESAKIGIRSRSTGSSGAVPLELPPHQDRTADQGRRHPAPSTSGRPSACPAPSIEAISRPKVAALQRRTHEIEAPVGLRRARQAAHRNREGEYADRHIDREQPRP